jgi:cytochrome c554/c'-like protein
LPKRDRFANCARLWALLLVGALTACGSTVTQPLDPATLRDPTVCKSCHPAQFDDWSGSMHAFASDDPVFVAMNTRAQRETVGATGKFCVNCHAPMAVRDGLTTDGLNLATIVPAEKGVTCYFCHSAESITGTHDDPLVLATDNALLGPFGDPVVGTPHVARASTLFDDTSPDSAKFCGSCHDIVNQHGAHVERTYQEWQGTLFAAPGKGLSCQACHMDGSDGPASSVSTKVRRVHRHDLVGVDLATATFPNVDAQRTRAQTLLDSTVQSTLCWNPTKRAIEVTLDNVGAGHGFPSGATPDRRAWVEVEAFAGGQQIYASGGAAAAPLVSSPDPDLWLVRDCLFDAAGVEQTMFWQAATETSNQLPGSVTANVTDPASFTAHRQRLFPSAAGATLAQTPDMITLKVHVQAIGDDVLADLVSSGDLDQAIPATVAKYELAGAAVTWTPTTAVAQIDAATGLPKPCVTTGRFNPMVTAAESHARCGP